MIAYLAQAVGAPTPTLVLDAGPLPRQEDELRTVLTTVRCWLEDHGHGHVLKFALVKPSPHPLFDLDYRFVQGLPGGTDRFDFRGSCGHSILSSVLAADNLGWLPRLSPGNRIRVQVLNNGDHVVCEVDEARRNSGNFTVHFLQGDGIPLGELLLTGQARQMLMTADGMQEASLVATGNPYVFVDAASLGMATQQELFTAGETLYDRLLRIRTAASAVLGWPPESVFPKIAAVGAYTPGRLSVRAISVPSWHPTLALTGATCLAAAAAIPGTVPARLLQQAGITADDITIDTPASTTHVAAYLSGGDGEASLQWVSVKGKHAHLNGPAPINELSSYLYRKDRTWQPLTV
ncbi:PrpF domain-containing protein [Streptomyces glaucus]|uniref:3-methylitaconate isomerase n=1 Tax=Streptomyces glaucus TaxID=284029 RepID=A0ABP5XCV2_9ACTN